MKYTHPSGASVEVHRTSDGRLAIGVHADSPSHVESRWLYVPSSDVPEFARRLIALLTPYAADVHVGTFED